METDKNCQLLLASNLAEFKKGVLTRVVMRYVPASIHHPYVVHFQFFSKPDEASYEVGSYCKNFTSALVEFAERCKKYNFVLSYKDDDVLYSLGQYF